MRRCLTLIVLLASPATALAGEQSFGPIGAEQAFFVPDGVASVRIAAVGAPGATPTSGGGAGGAGGTAAADVGVTPGQVLYVDVGGVGRLSGATAFNGGGGGYGGGGGASDVRLVLRTETGSLESRLVVAGGGGGGGLTGSATGGNGGGVEGTTGGVYPVNSSPCASTAAGAGGNQSAGGARGIGDGATTDGTAGAGGTGYDPWTDDQGGGGGGGGWFGGGGAANCGGGGGGSGHFAEATSNRAFGVAPQGTPPSVTITWTLPDAPSPSPSPSPGPTASPVPAAPETTITTHPKARVKTKRRRARVRFSFTASDPNATFRCRLDTGPERACDPGQPYRVKRGKHTFTVVAILTGVRDATPATFGFTVQKSKKKRTRSHR